jgi:hypothetical protein
MEIHSIGSVMKLCLGVNNLEQPWEYSKVRRLGKEQMREAAPARVRRVAGQALRLISPFVF